MVWMLIVGHFFAAITGVVVIVRLDKRIFRQYSLVAVFLEVIVCAEEFRLVLKQIHDLHRRTGRVVVIDLGRVLGSSFNEPRVYALERLDNVERVHIPSSERRAIMSKRAVAARRTRNRSKPPVEH